jgi:hypothetical protein
VSFVRARPCRDAGGRVESHLAFLQTARLIAESLWDFEPASTPTPVAGHRCLAAACGPRRRGAPVPLVVRARGFKQSHRWSPWTRDSGTACARRLPLVPSDLGGPDACPICDRLTPPTNQVHDAQKLEVGVPRGVLGLDRGGRRRVLRGEGLAALAPPVEGTSISTGHVPGTRLLGFTKKPLPATHGVAASSRAPGVAPGELADRIQRPIAARSHQPRAHRAPLRHPAVDGHGPRCRVRLRPVA